MFDDEYLVTSLRKKDLVKSLNLIKKDDTILDFGAGKCHYKKLLEEKCKKFIKVDFQTDDFNEIDFVTDKNGKIPVKNKSIDMVYSLQVLEHVENLDLYIEACSKLLKPNGLMFTATLNRTFESYIKAIVGAEYVTRWLPIGTHDWNKFIKPDELKKKLEKYNFSIFDTEGVVYNTFLRQWKRSNDCAVNYIVTSIKH